MESKMAAAPEERSPEETKQLARLAGAVYVSLGLASAFGFYHAPLVQGDLSTIAHRLTQSDMRFHIGVVSDVLSTALSVPLALLLYQLLKPVHKMQAVWMAGLLIAAMPISFVVALNYVAAHWLLTGAPEGAALTRAQREGLGMLFLRLHTHRVLAGGNFLGPWLIAFGPSRPEVCFFPR